MDFEESADEQQLANGLTFDGGKKGQIYVVDFGEHMFQGEDDKKPQWRFRLALQTVRDQINQQCCTGDMNELGAVIFFNTTQSKTSRESIECIFVHRELGTFDADYVKRLDELLAKPDLLAEMQPELGPSGICDWGDVILACQDVLQSIKALRKKVINIFTTDNAEFIDSNSLKAAKKRVLEELAPKNVDIKVFVLEEDKDEETEFTKFLKAISPEMGRYTNFDQLREGLHFKNYSLRSTTSVPFILGEGFQFAVGIYFLIKPLDKPKGVSMDSETNEKIELRSHYIPKDKEIVAAENAPESTANSNLVPGAVEGEVFEGEVNFMRNVGDVDIVLSREEMENLRRFDQPGITLIGFKPMKLLKDSHRMSPAKFIHPLDNVISGSSKLYRALLNRCIQRQLFILVRYTQKTNTPPQLCALVPQSNTNEDGKMTVNSSYVYEGFHLLELPFAEEARNLRDRYGPPPDGLGKWPSPDDQKINAAREFVRKLIKGFTPDQFANPVLQRHYKGVETLALDLSMESFEEEVSKLDALQPYFLNPANVCRVANEIAKLKELCSSSKEEKKPAVSAKKGSSSKDKIDFSHGNFPANLLSPAPLYGPISPITPAGTLATGFEDCYESALENLRDRFGVEHLSECAEPKLFEYPIAGIVHGANRLVIPLKVRAFPNSKNFVVFFVFDTGAPMTSLTRKTMLALSAGRDNLQEIIIQDRHFPCRLSSNCSESMANVNLLGSPFQFHLDLCCIFSPHPFDYISDPIRIFYLTPFKNASQVLKMAAFPHQNPNIRNKLHNFSSSNPEATSKLLREEKVFYNCESKEKSTSASTQESDVSQKSSINLNLDGEENEDAGGSGPSTKRTKRS